MHLKYFRFLECLVLNMAIYFTIAHVTSSPVVDQSLNLASDAIDAICTSTISLHNALQLQKPDISSMYFRHITACRNYSVPLEEAEKLRKHKLFDRKKKVAIFVTGWQNTVNNSNSLAKMSKAFQCRDDFNFLFVDVASHMDTIYKWAAINTQEVGKFIAIGLTSLIKIVPLRNIHLIGHSLGAHMMGIAGRTFTNLTNGLRIFRITGLDPAKPCFGDENKLESLGKGDARLVDVIHSNIGVLGVREPIGHIDFYPGGAKSLQPGCSTIDCAHSRAVEYFIESIYPQHELDFPAHKCRSWEDLEALKCSKGSSNLYMGFRLSNRNFGIFYVDTNEKPPFGKNAKPLKPIEDSVCRRRPIRCN